MGEKNYPNTITLTVTKKDIKVASEKYNSARMIGIWHTSCPISIAAKRMFPDAYISTTSLLNIDGIRYASVDPYNNSISEYVGNTDSALIKNRPQDISPIVFHLKKHYL